MMNKTLLWLDDSRDPFYNDGEWLIFSPISDYTDIIWIKSFDEFKKFIDKNGAPYIVCFDYDIDIEEKYNGLDCVNYLINHCKINKEIFPLYNFQSANSDGRILMAKQIKDYNYGSKTDE